MEQKLARSLTKDEDVHHINGIKTDNRIENLQLISHKKHASLTNTKDRVGIFCSICGSKTTRIRKESGRPHWYGNEKDGWLCGRCRDKIYYNKKLGWWSVSD